ncbi:WD40 repeat-like protein [Roridomyces roridus]|uniref:WD40 repeat-like protein n=1 Tax=Roridomyces roridus TaxID=1738132 RepID=A0AAD7B715_9AGAR|nr:WD40 repeat-like protein [Roridomyces roridus]
MSAPTKLPVVTVQPTFLQVIREVRDGIVPSDTFWISCYNHPAPSIHSKVRVTLDDVNRDAVHFEPSAGVEIKDIGRDEYVVSAPKFGVPETRIRTPTFPYADPTRSDLQHPHRITAFDVAPDGSQFATGFLDGSVHIYSAAQKTPPAETAFGKPHKSTTNSLRFFPSSRVLLSAGADFTLCILPAELAPASSALSPVRTLMGHRRAITSTAIVSRGRNVISSSLDGTIRLWDVPSGEKIHVLSAGADHFVPVTSTSLGPRAGTAVPTAAPQDPDPREVETSDSLLFCALQTKSFEAFDLSARASVYLSPPGTAPLTSITYAPEHNLLATGSSAGIVDLYDTRALDTPLLSFTRGEAGIADLAFGEDGKTLVVTTDDGLPFVARCSPGELEPVKVEAELIGADCDPVRHVRVVGRDVWSAADDGVVRKYTAVY